MFVFYHFLSSFIARCSLYVPKQNSPKGVGGRTFREAPHRKWIQLKALRILFKRFSQNFNKYCFVQSCKALILIKRLPRHCTSISMDNFSPTFLRSWKMSFFIVFSPSRLRRLMEVISELVWWNEAAFKSSRAYCCGDARAGGEEKQFACTHILSQPSKRRKIY